MSKKFYVNLFSLFLAAILLMTAGCGKRDPLEFLEKKSGVDLPEGKVLFETDTHGGFHGDGCLQMAVQFDGGSVSDRLQGSEKWKPLPLSDNLNRFVCQPYYDALEIPAVEHGCYFFYDRFDDDAARRDPYDDSALLSRAALNFTLAVFDTDSGTLYLLEFDS